MLFKTFIEFLNTFDRKLKTILKPPKRIHICLSLLEIVPTLVSVVVVSVAVFLSGCKKTDQSKTNDPPTFAIYSALPNKIFSQGISEILSKENSEMNVVIANDIDEAIESQADVLIIVMDRSVTISQSVVDKLKKKKVIGIGYGAAEIFSMLGLEINNGACAHSDDHEPVIRIQDNNLLRNLEFTDSFKAFDIPLYSLYLTDIKKLDYNFSMHIPEKSHLCSVVDVIARNVSDDNPRLENYAPIVRQGNYILIGLAAPPNMWSPKYRSLFRQISYALHSRPLEKFSIAQWEVTSPGTYDFSLAESNNTKGLSRRTFYFKFSRPTTFTASLEHKGSNSMMMLYMGDSNYTSKIRKDAKQGEQLKIKIDINDMEIDMMEDRYWKLDVTNFDSENPSNCSLDIRYDNGNER